MASYSDDKSSYGSRSDSFYPYDTSSSTTAYANRTTIWSVGPLAIIGIRARLFGPVNLSAEMNVSAVYQWTTGSGSSTYQSTDQFQNSSISVSTSESDLKGWSIALSRIQIGVILEL